MASKHIGHDDFEVDAAPRIRAARMPAGSSVPVRVFVDIARRLVELFPAAGVSGEADGAARSFSTASRP
jgi:hypothetical protein